jgi:hypothetical protein
LCSISKISLTVCRLFRVVLIAEATALADSFGISFLGFLRVTTRDKPPATVEIPPVTF